MEVDMPGIVFKRLKVKEQKKILAGAGENETDVKKDPNGKGMPPPQGGSYSTIAIPMTTRKQCFQEED